MSKVEEANNILEKIRGKDFVKENPFVSEEKAEDFIDSVGFTMLGASSFCRED